MASVGNVIEDVNAVLQLAPAILQLMLAIEQIFAKKPKTGEIKKALVLSAIPLTIAPEIVAPFIDKSASLLFPNTESKTPVLASAPLV